jgi:hypothetical protein
MGARCACFIDATISDLRTLPPDAWDSPDKERNTI